MTEIHIVGGGVAGLALAGLVPRDYSVHLYDGGRDARTVPTVFGLWPAAMRVLDDLGLTTAARAAGRRLDEARFHDRRGRVLARLGGQDVWLVARTELVRMLWSNLPANVTVHRRTIERTDDLGGDLVVGADGVHSVVRASRWRGAGPPRRLGATAIRGVVDEPIAGDRLSEYWGAGTLVGMTPHPDGGTNWFCTVPRERFSGRAEALTAIRTRLDGHPAPVRRLLAAADPDRTLVNDLWAARWPRRLVRGDAVLIGDAAHAMSPSLGRGAGESLIDAQVLGTALRTASLEDALRRYERNRLLRSHLVRVASSVVLQVATARRERLRNAVVALAAWPATARGGISRAAG